MQLIYWLAKMKKGWLGEQDLVLCRCLLDVLWCQPIKLSSRSRELLACQKFMTILMGHKAACVAKQHMQLRKSAVDFSQLLTVEVEGCLNFSDFFLYFLDLGFSQEFIASDQKQGNKILMTSSATMGLNFWSKIGSPIPMTSNSLCFYCF